MCSLGSQEHYMCDTEVDLCYSSPCINNGTCVRREGGYTCVCAPGYTGTDWDLYLILNLFCRIVGQRSPPPYASTLSLTTFSFLCAVCFSEIHCVALLPLVSSDVETGYLPCLYLFWVFWIKLKTNNKLGKSPVWSFNDSVSKHVSIEHFYIIEFLTRLVFL